MADLVLKDRDGTAITYNGVEVVSIPNAEGGTSHFLNLETGGIPSGGTDGQVLKKLSATDYDVGWENEVDITDKADKVTGGTADNFASLDANGNLKDSGKKATDFEPKDATILKKGQVVNDLTTGGVNVPLSAEQGKLIKQEVDVLQSDMTGVSGQTVLDVSLWVDNLYNINVTQLGNYDAIFFTPSTLADKTALESANIIISTNGSIVTFAAETSPTVDISLEYFISRGRANE